MLKQNMISALDLPVAGSGLIVIVLRNRGHDMNMNSAVIDQNKMMDLPVEGLSCASCVKRVETAIRKIEGVQSVSVNLATEMVNVKPVIQVKLMKLPIQ